MQSKLIELIEGFRKLTLLSYNKNQRENYIASKSKMKLLLEDLLIFFKT